MGGMMHLKTSLLSPATPDQQDHANDHVYRPHGKFASTYGLQIVSDGGRLQLKGGSAAECSVSLQKGTLGGQAVTYIQKEYPECSQAFNREVYMYSHNDLLRPLQGVYVPLLIGAHIQDGRPYIVMEPVDECAWRSVDSPIDELEKENIRQAYRRLHARGILHGCVKGQKIIFGGVRRVCLLNFSNAATVEDHTAGGIRRCTREDLAEEACIVDALLNSPAKGSASRHDIEIPKEMRSPQRKASPKAQDSSSASLHGNLTQPSVPTDRMHSQGSSQHMSSKSQATAFASGERPSLLDVSAVVAGMQHRSFDRLSVSEQSPLQPKLASPREKSSRPKRVAFHLDMEDKWTWSREIRTPKLSLENREAHPNDEWQQGDDDNSNAVQSASPGTSHLTYQEPPPRPAEDTTGNDEGADFETVIIITSPTGDNCVYGVSAEIAARIQKDLIFAKAKPLPHSSSSGATQKRKAASPHPDWPLSKRAAHKESDIVDELPVARAVPKAGPSSALKRKIEDDHEGQDSPTRQSKALMVEHS